MTYPTSENADSRFRPLLNLATQFGDAAFLRESAADHSSAALQAARKIDAPKDIIVALQQALAQDEATAARLFIKRDVAQAILKVKRLKPGTTKLVHEANGDLSAALQRHQSYADAGTHETPPC